VVGGSENAHREAQSKRMAASLEKLWCYQDEGE
jgi:hypothetical protein